MNAANAEELPSRIVTRFGAFEVEPQNIVRFPAGLPGFEQCHHLVILSSPAIAPLQCLQALDGQLASFLVVDPRLVLPDYRCVLSGPDAERLGGADDTPLLWLAVVTSRDEGDWVNLRAPIVINPSRMVGFQVIPHSSLYPLRHPIAGA